MKITLQGRYKNGLLLDVLREHGWNQRQLATALQVSPSVVSKWMLLQDYPREAPLRQRVEQVTRRLADDLFPPALVEALRQSPPPVEVSRDLDPAMVLSDVRRLGSTSPEVLVLEHERHEAVYAMLDVLTPRERDVLCRHWGLSPYERETLATIARTVRLSTERVRQIEERAFRKLHHACMRVEEASPADRR